MGISSSPTLTPASSFRAPRLFSHPNPRTTACCGHRRRPRRARRRDRGFQILLTAYPEVCRLVDLPALQPQPFFPGALVFHSGRFHRVADPFRLPLAALPTLPNPIGSIPDKLLVGLARLRAASIPHDVLLSAPETSISDRLRSSGFSPYFIDRFFRPFLAGIFFDPDLSTTSRLFDFVFRCLALGDNALPANGIAAIPSQLAARLPASSLRLQSRVSSINPGLPRKVSLHSGDAIAAELGVILAVEQPEAQKLLHSVLVNQAENKPARSTVCIYFSANRAPISEPILILNGSGEGIVNNMFFPTNVAPSYGPAGKVLVSVSLVGEYNERSDEDLTAEVVKELGGWFGSEEVGSWEHLRTYRIGFAQPDQTPPTDLTGKDPGVAGGVYVCGDHWASATFDGGLVSGRRAAEALIADLERGPLDLLSTV
ncbi:putative amine oxidase, FAD/NAD(P)-binding domain superfamily [Dioscorea sansibarensis]